jgi:hypothetical protein
MSIMSAFDPKAYGPVFAPLLAVERRRALGAGRADEAARGAVERVTVESAFAHGRMVDADMAACCVAGVWLVHDFLDESHTISQGIETPSGSFWHGIMHRREGDFGNSKYWFRRVGTHPVYEVIAERSQHVGESLRDSQSRLGETRPREWDPFAFVDECQAAVRGTADARERCLDLQQIEWEALFDYCYHAASGIDGRR